MFVLLSLSYFGSFGGINALVFPWDVVMIFPLSWVVLYFSQRVIVSDVDHEEALSEILRMESVEA